MIKNKYRISYNNLFIHPKRCRNFFLFQAGETLCAKDTVISQHQQQYFEITYVVGGQGVSYVNDTPVEISKNDCFFSFPGETHMIKSDKNDPLRFVFLSFYAKEKSQGNTLINYILQNCKSANTRSHHIESIYPLCNGILQELKQEDMYSVRILSFLLEQILIECCRNISQKTKTVPKYAQTDASILTHDIITYIDNNIFKIKTISELEDVFFYNINKLSKCFQAQTGISLNKYFVNKKMETAFQLLEEGNSVTEISDKLQYSSIHAFSRAYKNYFHSPPSAFQRKDKPNK